MYAGLYTQLLNSFTYDQCTLSIHLILAQSVSKTINIHCLEIIRGKGTRVEVKISTVTTRSTGTTKTSIRSKLILLHIAAMQNTRKNVEFVIIRINTFIT